MEEYLFMQASLFICLLKKDLLCIGPEKPMHLFVAPASESVQN